MLKWAWLMIVVWAGAAAYGQTAPTTQPAGVVVELPDASALPSSPGYFIVKAQVTADGQQFPMALGLFLPPGYFRTDESFPVVVALHNRGVEGDDGRATSFEGLGALLARDEWDTRTLEVRPGESTPPQRPANAINLRTDAAFIGIVPQCPKGKLFTDATMPGVLSELITEVGKYYRTDESRVYLTGFSYGGTCTWFVAEQLPERFAAIVPLSTRATADPASTARVLSKIGVYMGTGTNEWAVPFVRQMRDAFAAAGHERFIYREIQGGTHWVYPLIYTDPELWDWLFSQRRAKSGIERQP